MKVRIKSGEFPSYLTVGRVYDALDTIYKIFYDIQEDGTGDYIRITLDNCVHLKGGSWEIVDE